ncbi:LuxR family transcriptional regulator [Rhodococcus sp. 06-156-3C]|nr:LuxR family transcriptional regulator [Rhodococcus sp. 06-156-4C]OZD18763.1 LuxR family transcriptional regulator [Rhodococcus sp. 06-156-3C]OZD22273.1 LuxR family transcriptional regulator [Rhodococcus sp. 06-156-4a]OZD34079.1 LuxR family transcriptional regulator [Rhodococcus sp. 06-156-3b]OZD38816.1 LuxR family transcriptional regulator [Rhodococcus sp. 06-156-3]OZF57276.1 LuxR family transcriptional regulator [Rhodococcus sp. 06-156-4]
MVLTSHRAHTSPPLTESGSLRASRSPLGPRPSSPRPNAVPPLTPRPALASTISPPALPVYAKPGLTEREIAVLKVWLDCDSKLDVAKRLHIALGTVNTHLSRIRDKYTRVGRPAPTKAGLVARALQDGIVTLDDL